MKTVMFGIGRNVGDSPMSDNQWSLFIHDLKGLVQEAGGILVAGNVGATISADWGKEDGFWLIVNIEEDRLTLIEPYLAILAKTNGQDAIAVSVISETRFVEGK